MTGPFGAPPESTSGTLGERIKAKAKAVLIGGGLLAGGLVLTSVTHIAAFAPLGLIAVCIYLARRVHMDLRAAAVFAMLALFLGASAATDAGTAKQVRPMVKTANVGTVSMSTGAVTALPGLAKQGWDAAVAKVQEKLDGADQ